MADAQAKEESSPNKKLRFSEPDLKILLHYTKKNGESAIKEYRVYAQVLAKQSKFVDTALSVNMKEKGDRAITLSDTTPQIYELAMKFLQDLSAARLMEAEDALNVVEFYHMYEFTGGIHLCDQVLKEYFVRHLQKTELEPPENLKLLIDAVMMADKLSLTLAKKSGLLYLNDKLECVERNVPYGSSMFTTSNFRKLQPLFVKRELRFDYEQLSRKELKSELFPKHAVKCIAMWHSDSVVSQTCGEIQLKLSGTEIEADGKYAIDSDCDYLSYVPTETATRGPWDTETTEIRIERFSGDWEIVKYTDGEGYETVRRELWKCPYSENLNYPPKGAWVPMDRAARGTPRIEYI